MCSVYFFNIIIQGNTKKPLPVAVHNIHIIKDNKHTFRNHEEIKDYISCTFFLFISKHFCFDMVSVFIDL